MTQHERPKNARGGKPTFFSDPAIDKLVAITMALAGEVSVLRDRLDTHEQLAQKEQLPTRHAVEAFVVTDTLAVARQSARDEFVNRIYRAVTDELGRLREIAGRRKLRGNHRGTFYVTEKSV